MNIRFFFLISIFVGGLFTDFVSAVEDNNDARLFTSKWYDIHINDEECTYPTDCENIKAIIVDKKNNSKIKAVGQTITIGFGKNLRGYELYSDGYKFEIKQPDAKLDEEVDFDKWTISVEIKNKNDHYTSFFKDTGEIIY